MCTMETLPVPGSATYTWWSEMASEYRAMTVLLTNV